MKSKNNKWDFFKAKTKIARVTYIIPTTTRSTFKSSQSIAKMKNCTFIVPDALLPSFESVAATKIFEEKEALALIGSASLS